MTSVKELIEKRVFWDDMTEEELRAFVNYWFGEYERTGFVNEFLARYSDYREQYNGQPFEVIGRCGEDTYDLKVLPVWRIRLECGVEIVAHPEEICKLERDNQDRHGWYPCYLFGMWN